VSRTTLDVRSLEPAEVLRRLYNASFSAGLGRLHFDPKDMTLEQARELIEARRARVNQDTTLSPEERAQYLERHGLHFDYVQGRVIKVNLGEREALYVGLYDRDNGEGAAARALGLEPEAG
jgi:hypothetical protein